MPRANRHLDRRGGGEDDGLLEADDPAFLEILDRLASDPDYKALVLANPVVTHGPYKSLHLRRFLKEYPSERGGLSDADIKKYERIYRANYFALSWNFPGTIERLGLTPEEVARLVQVVELLYVSNVNHLDQLFGAIVAEVGSHGLLDESLIAFTTDHGELMYRETAPFAFTHGMQLAPEVLNIPLIIHGPGAGVESGRYENVTRSMDVFPTLAGLSQLAVDPKDAPPGVDLSRALRGVEPPPDLAAYSHTTVLVDFVQKEMQDPAKADSWVVAKRLFPDQSPERMWVSVVEDGYVYKRTSDDGSTFSMQVFDVENDPGEARDLYDEGNPAHREAEARLIAYKQKLVGKYEALQATEAARRLPRSREAQALRALGYIE